MDGSSMKITLPLLMAIIALLLNPVLLSYGSSQVKTYELLGEGYIQAVAKITCWQSGDGPKMHIKIDVTKVFHMKGRNLVSAWVADMTKDGADRYIAIGQPIMPHKEYDYIAFERYFDRKDFPSANNDSCPIADLGRIAVVIGTSPPSDADTLTEGTVDIIAVSSTVDISVGLNVTLDQDVYGLGDLVFITGTVKPVIEGRSVLINVVSPNGAIHNFDQITPDADGTFKQEFRLTGQLAVSGEWKVTITYLGSQVEDYFIAEELPTEFIQPIEFVQVDVQSSSIVNDRGETLDRVRLGSPAGIQTELANNGSSETALTYIVQVTDAQGFTVMISWIKGITLKPDTSMKPAVFWMPEGRGNYNVEIFVWESLENPMPLSAPRTMKVTVA
jgi:hypothetical protein